MFDLSPRYANGADVQVDDEVWYEYQDAQVISTNVSPIGSSLAPIARCRIHLWGSGEEMIVPAVHLTPVPYGCPPETCDR